MNQENYDPCFPDQPVVDLYLPIWSNLPAFRSKPAFIWAEDASTSISTLTYAQLHHSVTSISSRLLLGLQRGDPVMLLCPPGLDLIQVLFACQRAGLLTIPLLPPHPSFHQPNSYHHFLRVVSQTGPKAAIAPPTYISLIKQYINSFSSSSSSSSSDNPDLVVMLRSLTWISTEDIKHRDTDSRCMDSQSYNGCKVSEVYLIQYTSGATAIPKPVLVTAGSAAHNVRAARKAYDLHPNSMIVSWLPQYHDCGLMFLLLTIVSGATCVLTSPAAFVNRPMLWLELVSDFKATCTPVPSFTLNLIMRHYRSDLHHQKGNSNINLLSLKNLILVNEPLYQSSVKEFLHVFQPYGLNLSCIAPSYGLAENCTFVSTAWRSNNNHWDSFPSFNKLLPSAKLADDQSDEDQEVEIILVNEETHEPVDDGVEGEIWISSPSNAFGYLGHPFLTRDVFQARLKGKISSRCYIRTGDTGIVKRDERFLYVTGRCADLIEIQNNQDQIHPHYIETAAYNCYPQFLRGGCLACFSISRTITLVAELQRIEEDESVFRKVCDGIKQGVLKEENVEIGRVVLVKRGSVPKTTSGKIQRWAAMDKLVREQMSVIMEMRINQAGGFSFFLPTHATKGKSRERAALSLM